MKFYVHFEQSPEFTMVFKWDSTQKGNLSDVLEKFVAAFNERNARELTVDTTSLLNKKQNPLQLESEISTAVKDGADLFVVPKDLELSPDLTDETSGSLQSIAQSAICSAHINQLLAMERLSELSSSLSFASFGGGHAGEGSRPPNSKQGADDKDKEEDGDVPFTLENLLRTKGNSRDCARLCASALRIEENNAAALSCLAEIYLSAERPQLALEYIEQAMRTHPDDQSLNFIFGKCLSAVGRLEEATAAFLKHMNHLESTNASKSKIHDVEAEIAKICAKEGNIRMAVELFSDVLKEDKGHVESLKEFAIHTAGSTPKDLHEAIAVMMSALIHSGGPHSIRKQVAKLIARPGGMGVFKNQLKDTWISSESMMYMADVLRDSGVVKQAATLVKRGLQISPHDPNIILYLVHTYEVLGEHNKAFLEARAFLKRNHALKVGNFSCSQMVPYLQGVTGDIYLNRTTVRVVPKVNSGAEAGEVLNSELHLLGLLMTLVKIFFVKGALSLVKPLLPIFDILVASRPLRFTTLCNEAAYYTCISEVMKVPFKPPLPQNPKFIYFASDSHCIPSAWRVIRFQEKQHVIHPLLATGVKIWHIRKDGCFYAKISLLNALKTIPSGSHLIVNVGELDCREGLVRALNSCKYDSLEDAIEETVGIYLEFLKEQMKQRKFVIYVHPIIPILNESQQTVLQFNEKLKEAVLACDGLRWLNLLEDLLVGEGPEFNSEYKLDGTHLHPKYVSLLEKALKSAY